MTEKITLFQRLYLKFARSKSKRAVLNPDDSTHVGITVILPSRPDKLAEILPALKDFIKAFSAYSIRVVIHRAAMPLVEQDNLPVRVLPYSEMDFTRYGFPSSSLVRHAVSEKSEYCFLFEPEIDAFTEALFYQVPSKFKGSTWAVGREGITQFLVYPEATHSTGESIKVLVDYLKLFLQPNQQPLSA